MEDKKVLICKAASAVFAREGFHKASVKSIAQEANIAVGTIYLYFKTKEDILDYIFKIEHEKRIAYLRSLQGQGMTLREILTKFLEFHFIELGEHENINRVLIQESTSPLRTTSDSMKSFSIELPNEIRKMLETAQTIGEIEEMDCEVGAQLIFQIIRNSVFIAKSQQLSRTEKQIQDAVLGFIFKGIGS